MSTKSILLSGASKASIIRDIITRQQVIKNAAKQVVIDNRQLIKDNK